MLNLSLSYSSFLNKQTALGNIPSSITEWISDVDTATQSMVEEYSSVIERPEQSLTIVKDQDHSILLTEQDESFFDHHAKDLNRNIPDMVDITPVSDYSARLDEKFMAESSEGVFEDSFENDMLLQSSHIDERMLNLSINNDSGEKEINSGHKEKFMIVGDNLDFRIKRRHTTREKGNIDYHLFRTIAVKNRVPIPEKLYAKEPKVVNRRSDIDLMTYIPNKEDEKHLQDEFASIFSRDLLKYFDELKWAKGAFPRHMNHQYTEEMKKKSEVISLGISDQNESTNDGIISILKSAHDLVPGNKSSHITRTFFIGDLLTTERAKNAQQHLQDGQTPTKRLEGLIPGLADFHTYGNFMEVIWHILYDTRSGSNIGSLYQARNYLNSRNVTNSPMGSLNACEELLLKYSETLSIVVFKKYRKNNPLMYKEMIGKQDVKSYKTMIYNLVDDYILSSMSNEDSSTVQYYNCPDCSNKYKTRNNLLKHIKESHKFTSNESTSTCSDAINNYSRNALMLTFLIRDFRDARQHGDGERIIRLYKYLMLGFKIASRTKYSFESLHLLAQINELLPPALAHELIWNRTVNNTGKIDGNVELDRELEHRNKYAKKDLKALNGKVTAKSIERVSSLYQIIEEICNNFDENTHKHTTPKW